MPVFSNSYIYDVKKEKTISVQKPKGRDLRFVLGIFEHLLFTLLSPMAYLTQFHLLTTEDTILLSCTEDPDVNCSL